MRNVFIVDRHFLDHILFFILYTSIGNSVLWNVFYKYDDPKRHNVSQLLLVISHDMSWFSTVVVGRLRISRDRRKVDDLILEVRRCRRRSVANFPETIGYRMTVTTGCSFLVQRDGLRRDVFQLRY